MSRNGRPGSKERHAIFWTQKLPGRTAGLLDGRRWLTRTLLHIFIFGIFMHDHELVLRIHSLDTVRAIERTRTQIKTGLYEEGRKTFETSTKIFRGVYPTGIRGRSLSLRCFSNRKYVDETRFTTWPSFSAERGSASLGFSDFNLYSIPSLWIFTRMPPIYVYGAEPLCEYDSSRFIKNHWMNRFLVMDGRVEMFYRSSIEGNRRWMAFFFIFAELLSFLFFLICVPLFLLRSYKKKVNYDF